MTKNFLFALTLAFTTIISSFYTPAVISVDIQYCDQNKAFEKSICTIQEAETLSRNKILIDQNGNINDIIVDKRSMTSEKANALFGGGTIIIEKRNVIDVPHLQKSILIRPGEYVVKEMRRGFKIKIR